MFQCELEKSPFCGIDPLLGGQKEVTADQGLSNDAKLLETEDKKASDTEPFRVVWIILDPLVENLNYFRLGTHVL